MLGAEPAGELPRLVREPKMHTWISRLGRRHALTLAGIGVVYVAAGKLGLSLALVNESASAVWPPTGLALAACLLLGPRVWPALAVGAFIVNFTTSGRLAPSLLIAAGNTLEALLGASLVARYAGGAAAFDSPRDVFRFALLGGVCATIVSASIGAGTLTTFGLAAPGDLPSVFVTWWIGDMVGAVLVAPPLVLWGAARPAHARRPAETLLLSAAVLAVSWFVFGPSPVGLRGYSLEFLPIAVLLWAAFRFGGLVTAACAAAMSVIAVWGTLGGYGRFATDDPNESLLLLQAFMGVVSTMMLAVAAEVAARRRASRSLRELNDSLEQHVRTRTEELVKLRDRLNEAQAVAHVGSWEWDVAGNTLWWSDELYRIYGIAPEEAASYEGFLAHVHPDDRARVDGVVRQALHDGRPFAFEHRIVRGDGTTRALFGQGRVFFGSDGTPLRMSGIGHDITELKQAEEERAQLMREQVARREAEEANRAKDQFLAMLSHELRTPMNAVLGWAQMLHRLPADDARQRHAVDAIFRNVRIQSQLISDILDVSRIATGTLGLEPGIVNLAAVIDDAVETVREAAESKRISIDVQRPPDALELIGDATRLRQVVWNLLANAVKFVQKGGSIVVRVAAEPDAFEVVVEDDGPGIAPEFLPHVFDRFRQADVSITREHGGLGLGLAIVRHIVELHGGTVAASNRAPRGARFSVRLPASRAIAAAPGVARA